MRCCESFLINFVYITMVRLLLNTIEERVLIVNTFYCHNESYAKTARNLLQVMDEKIRRQISQLFVD